MQGRTPKAVVIGGTYVDMAVKCQNIPLAGRSVNGSGLSYTISGPGPNQSAQLKLCGCDVHLISKIGSDSFAETVKQSLGGLHINSEFVYKAEAKNTGLIVTLVNCIGENASCRCVGANNSLTPHEIESAENIISEADICLINGQFPQDTIIKALRCAKLHGTKIILNPARPIDNNSVKNSDLPVEYFLADTLILNLFEAIDLTEKSVPSTDRGTESAKLIGTDLVERGANAVVITMGKRGSLVVDRKGTDYIPAFEVELVDQAAKGDAFAGALAAYCAVKDDIRDAVKFASAAGALACTKFGSLDALPTKAEIIQMLQKHD